MLRLPVFCYTIPGYNIGPFRAIEGALAILPDQFDVHKQDQGLPGMTLLVNRCWEGQEG